MLLHLHIQNVAIIEESSFSLSEGLNAFTGETGAGKSILIDSLLLALGGRANTDLVRTGTEEATVSALFSLDGKHPIYEQLKEAGIRAEDELILRRLVSSNGRSRAYINEKPVTIAFLRGIGQQLCEISGQHEHQHLLHPRKHLDLLDNYGELTEEREEVRRQYEAVRDLRAELEQLGGDAHNRARRRGYLQYQIDELEEAELDADEEELDKQRRYMLKVEQMIEAAQGGEVLLYSGARSVLESVGSLQNQLMPFCELSEDIKAAADSLDEAQALIDDAARSLRMFASASYFDSNELEDLQERLTRLRDLKRKHGVQDIPGLQRCLQSYQDELIDLDSRETRMETIEANYHKEVETLQALAEALSAKRQKASLSLSQEAERELASLDMNKATFIVELTRTERSHDEDDEDDSEYYPEEEDEQDGFEQRPGFTFSDARLDLPGPTGYDQAQFLLSSNPGEEPKPIHRIASGGELSRIMLALKQVVAERDPVETCIFDEVDAGIGGVTASTIGKKISEIAETRQVLCITHLPQIASFAHHQYHIQKMEEDGRTHSIIQKLNATQREREIARMLGGMEANAQSRAHARELLSLTKAQAPESTRKSKPKNKSTKKSSKVKSKKAVSNGVSSKGKTSKKKSSTRKKASPPKTKKAPKAAKKESARK